MSTALVISQEQELSQEIGKGLEQSIKQARKIDKQISKSLNHKRGYMSKIPVIRHLSTLVQGIKPLGSLESELRKSLNNSLLSLVKVGKKSREEKERLVQLHEIYKTAIKDKWSSSDFLNFLEANTDINFVVKIDGQDVDLKMLFDDVDESLPKKRREEKRKEYADWFLSHIKLSEEYLECMHVLCFIGCEWIGGMTRSYFDLTQLRGGMEEIHRTLEHLGRGGRSSISSQQAIREYGAAYIHGMKSLSKGYKQMSALKSTGSSAFQTSLQQLKSDLNTAEKAVAGPSRKRLLLRKKDKTNQGE
tara:strand:- start:5212 stop:6123 length:912 start_codon:yes stop_codon:yes gene_type:complete